MHIRSCLRHLRDQVLTLVCASASPFMFVVCFSPVYSLVVVSGLSPIVFSITSYATPLYSIACSSALLSYSHSLSNRNAETQEEAVDDNVLIEELTAALRQLGENTAIVADITKAYRAKCRNEIERARACMCVMAPPLVALLQLSPESYESALASEAFKDALFMFFKEHVAKRIRSKFLGARMSARLLEQFRDFNGERYCLLV